MDKRAWWQAPEMIVAFAALIVSVFAVFVGAYSAYTDRTYARASVWPNILIDQISVIQDSNASYSVKLESNGIGPAIIKHASMIHNGKVINDYIELKKPYMKEFKDQNWSQTIIKPRVIPANSNVLVFQLNDSNKFAVDKFRKDMKNLNLTVCYCSVYDECWQVDKDNTPKAIEVCPLEVE
ncbi:hypothetical protein [Thalassotalea marina]